MTTYTYDNPEYGDQTVVVNDSHESQCTNEYKLLDLQQEIKLLRETHVSTCRKLLNADSSSAKIIRWNNEKISALKAESSVRSQKNLALARKNLALCEANIELKNKLEQATQALEASAPEDPDALRIWANRLLLTAPFLAAVAFGTATLGGIAASLGVSTLAINELTRAR